MRDQSVRYFIGSLFSRQVFYAYAIAGGLTTALQIIILSDQISRSALRTEQLPLAVELYIETLIPLWIPPVTSWNIIVFLANAVIAVWILLWWTVRYEQSMRF